MKTFTQLFFCVFLTLSLYAQEVPSGFSYQTIIRDLTTGNPLTNEPVVLSFNIRNNTADGAVVYQESLTTTTDQFGLINHVVGQGTPNFGQFNTISWGINPKFLEIAVEIDGQFQSIGSMQLWSVPYALYAQNVLGSSGSGTLWLVGPQDPLANQGEDDDFYLNSMTGDYFSKVAGAWLLQGNLKGPAGTPGAMGIPGEAGADGAGITQITDNGDGTLTINYGNGNMVATANLTGPPGADGAPGTMGIPGEAGADGAGITQITDNGDGTLTISYGNGNMVTTANLTGPPGADGAPGAMGIPGEAGADGAGITQITENGDGTLTINYGNGNMVTTANLTGPPGADGAPGTMGIPGEAGADGAGITQITDNGDGTLTISYGNGNMVTTANLTGPPGADGAPGAMGIPGEAGADGAGITQITDNGDGTLTISYGNGNMVTTANLTGPPGADGAPGAMGIPGEAGADGAGITQITDNGDGTLTISYGNGNMVTTANLTGPPGADGAPGAMGIPGEVGADGAGITQITDNGDGTLTISYGNGDMVTTANLTGPPGADGAPGETGATGQTGAQGADGSDGATWLTGNVAPDGGLGNDSDFYFQSSGQYYQKVAGTWTALGVVDTDPDNDLLVSSVAGGEVTGTFDNLQVAPAAIGLSNFSDMGATSPGAVMKWNGSTWELGTDNGEVYGPGLGIEIDGSIISANNEDEIWNASALRGRPIGGMDPQAGSSYFMVINGATDEYELVQIAGDVTGDFDSLSLQKIKGRPIGGMDPQSGSSYFMVINGATDEYELVQIDGDVTGDFDNLSLQKIKGRPIGGMDPQAGSSYFMVINGATDEYELVQIDGDITGDFDALQLNVPLQKGGSSNTQAMIDLTNNSTANSSYGFKSTSNGRQGLFGFFALDDPDFTYPAGVYGESNTSGASNVAGAGVMGRAVSGGVNNGIGGWFQGNYIGAIGVGYDGGQAGILGLSGMDGSEGARYGGLFIGATHPVSDNAALKAWDAGATYAGYFDGDVHVTGNLDMLTQFSAADKFFRIDHPLQPTEKYLYHSTVESPERKNIYDGVITTDADGYATVQMPDYFEALNTDFRYQLTVIGTFAQAIIAEKIADRQFVIRTDQPNVEVSWQVTGVRHDAFAKAYPFTPEVEKAPEKKGTYLHPEAFAQDKSKGEYQKEEFERGSIKKQ